MKFGALNLVANQDSPMHPRNFYSPPRRKMSHIVKEILARTLMKTMYREYEGSQLYSKKRKHVILVREAIAFFSHRELRLRMGQARCANSKGKTHLPMT